MTKIATAAVDKGAEAKYNIYRNTTRGERVAVTLPVIIRNVRDFAPCDFIGMKRCAELKAEE